MAITFDTQELVNELKQNGFTQEQSEAAIRALKKAQAELASKQDIVSVQRDIENLRVDTQRNIENLRLEIRQDMAMLGKDLTIRLGAMMAVAIGIVAVLVKLL